MKQLWLMALMPFPVFAADKPDIDLAATLGSLIFVIALILFFAWVLKRMRFTGVVGSPGSNIGIVKQLSVGTKERVAVIQVGEEQFLIGITSQNINMLSKLEKPLDIEKPTLTPFSTQLSQLMKKNAKN